MFSVALIGPDGAGKTTLTQMLAESGLLPFRYLYMGVNMEASRVALPTSRLVERVRRRIGPAEVPGGNGVAEKKGGRRAHGPLWAAARLGNRIAEAWYRQLVSWGLQLRGFVVLYDRHFVFDFAPEMASRERDSLDKRLYRWFLAALYPRPHLVIFLDAPGAVLFARKGELTPTELERRRQAFLGQSHRIRNFVRVDATRPLDVVYDEIVEQILRFHGDRHAETKR